MTILQKFVLVGALLMAAAPSLAEEAHHSGGATTDIPSATALEMPDGQPGMMGQGMMSGGMMGSGMMSVMEPMARMMAPEHIEGRIAFLETELKITDTQRSVWDAFADSLRANASDMGDMMAEMRGAMAPSPSAMPTTLLERLERHERMLATRLQGLREIKAALQPLYGALDDMQKRAADALLMPMPMGFM